MLCHTSSSNSASRSGEPDANSEFDAETPVEASPESAFDNEEVGEQEDSADSDD